MGRPDLFWRTCKKSMLRSNSVCVALSAWGVVAADRAEIGKIISASR